MRESADNDIYDTFFSLTLTNWTRKKIIVFFATVWINYCLCRTHTPTRTHKLHKIHAKYDKLIFRMHKMNRLCASPPQFVKRFEPIRVYERLQNLKHFHFCFCSYELVCLACVCVCERDRGCVCIGYHVPQSYNSLSNTIIHTKTLCTGERCATNK